MEILSPVPKKESFPKLPKSRDELDSGWGVSFLMVVRNANRFTKKEKNDFFKKRHLQEKNKKDNELKKIMFIKYNNRDCKLCCTTKQDIGAIKKGSYGFFDKEDDKIIFIVDGVQIAYYEKTITHLLFWI